MTLAEALLKVNGEVKLPADAVDGASRYMDGADVCIVALGEDRAITGEGKTMANIEISEEHVRYVKEAYEHGKKVVAVIYPLKLSNTSNKQGAENGNCITY